MNNLQRGDENIASTMLFSFLTRVHSSLYDPKNQVKFTPDLESEIKKIDTLNKLAANDVREMDKATLDYDWLWDSLFFARGYMETLRFNKKRKIMEPVVINPLMMNYDPYFENNQDWRYYDKWVTKSGVDIDRMIIDGRIDGIKSRREIASGIDPEIWNYKVIREQAKDVNSQGADSTTPMISGNGVYQLLEHYTYIGIEKWVVWTDKDLRKILRKEKLELHDNPEDDKQSMWPLVIKEVFKEPHSSVSVSVPDLIEDKHRAENVLLNLMYIAAKDEVTPLYGYDEDAISDEAQLSQRQIMQHIPFVKGTDISKALMPINKNPAATNSILQFMGLLRSNSTDAIGTTQVTPPVSKGKKSATGDALLQQVADLTASLQSKIMANAEMKFWGHWYQRYINNMKDADEKAFSVAKAGQLTFESIILDQIKTKYPPKATIFSQKEAEYKETVERREISQQFPILQQTIPPEKFVMFLKMVWFPKFKTFDSDTIDLIFPKSLDEIKAEQENDMIAKGMLPDIQETDDHETHLYVHARAKVNQESWTHILTHERLLAQAQKNNPTADKQLNAGQGKGDGSGAGGDAGNGGDAGGKTDPKQKQKKPGQKDLNANEVVAGAKANVAQDGKASKVGGK